MALLSLAFASCEKTMMHEGDVMASEEGGKSNSVGKVFTLSNNAAANQVMVYNRGVNGMLSFSAAFNTGGSGTGGGLGNQGAIALSDEGDLLVAVNPASNSISSFRANSGSLELVCVKPSGGMRPVSVTMYGGLVYVLNAGGTGNISGFTMSSDGTLSPLGGSMRPLSSSASGAAQICFVNDGTVLAITEKATNMIITYTVSGGLPDVYHSLTSANPTPFGFAVGKENLIYVSEAAGGAAGASTVSSYHISNNGEISLVTGPLSAGQTAACWVVITNNNKYVYATNTASNTITSFYAKNEFSIKQGVATTATNTPIDAALNKNSKFLYVLNSGDDTFGVFVVSNDGMLMHIQTVSGIPDGATGLAAE